MSFRFPGGIICRDLLFHVAQTRTHGQLRFCRVHAPTRSAVCLMGTSIRVRNTLPDSCPGRRRAISDGEATSKNDMTASVTFAVASSTVSPWQAISSSKHKATYTGCPSLRCSRSTRTVNSRVFIAFLPPRMRTLLPYYCTAETGVCDTLKWLDLRLDLTLAISICVKSAVNCFNSERDVNSPQLTVSPCLSGSRGARKVYDKRTENATD
jgi:hypothetical protein